MKRVILRDVQPAGDGGLLLTIYVPHYENVPEGGLIFVVPEALTVALADDLVMPRPSDDADIASLGFAAGPTRSLASTQGQEPHTDACPGPCPIYTLGDLRRWSLHELLGIRQVGLVALDNIIDVLGFWGYDLPSYPDTYKAEGAKPDADDR